jgi:predicted TIM-barrel fold metal-dependent hydrolase
MKTDSSTRGRAPVGAGPSILGVMHTLAAPGLPDNACDCHVHVLGDPERYPFDPYRTYTPRISSVAHLLQHQNALGFKRVVLVQPSAYGTDNRCMLDALREIGPCARAVVVIDSHTSDQALHDMHAAGVRGVRVNLETSGKNDPNAAKAVLQETAARVAPLGWHVQIYTNLLVINALHEAIAALPVPLVIDHFGKAMAHLGTEQPGFDVLLALLQLGKVWIKLSGAHRVAARADCGDVEPLVRAFLAANPDRLIWGSDWPHTGAWEGIPLTRDVINEFHPIDDGNAANRLRRWLSSADYQQKILVENPANLYQFE